MSSKTREIEFLRMELADLRAQLAAMEQKGEWIGLPENCEPAVVEQAVEVLKRIADHAASLGATQLAAEWIEYADAYSRTARAFRKSVVSDRE
jgi:hypothetical protein